MSRRRRRGVSGWWRPALGLALAPVSLAAGGAAAKAAADVARSTWAASPAWDGQRLFLAGFLGYSAAYSLGLARWRRLYVLGHELTHAAAAWMLGGKVYRLVVRPESGYVDLSAAGAFVSLAPYWVPFHALISVAAYRLVLWGGPPSWAGSAFSAAMGACLAFHLAHTVESLSSADQSDLEEAGKVLSLALIVLLNALVLLGALKCLFPASVSVSGALGGAASLLRAAVGAALP